MFDDAIFHIPSRVKLNAGETKEAIIVLETKGDGLENKYIACSNVIFLMI